MEWGHLLFLGGETENKNLAEQENPAADLFTPPPPFFFK